MNKPGKTYQERQSGTNVHPFTLQLDSQNPSRTDVLYLYTGSWLSKSPRGPPCSTYLTPRLQNLSRPNPPYPTAKLAESHEPLHALTDHWPPESFEAQPHIPNSWTPESFEARPGTPQGSNHTLRPNQISPTAALLKTPAAASDCWNPRINRGPTYHFRQLGSQNQSRPDFLYDR